MATERERHPELFQPRSYVDPRTRERTVPMEVLSLGFSRTGTASMQKAYEILGLPCHHGFTALTRPLDLEYWVEGLRAKYKPEEATCKPFGRHEFDHLLGEFSAISDFPAPNFAFELVAAYPEAKVVLVEREVEAWYKSFDEATIRGFFPLLGRLFSALDPVMAQLLAMSRLWAEGQFEAKTRQEVRANARRVYKEHYAAIRAAFPKERVLDFQLKDGWEPLCAFLEKDIPDCPFPRVNESKAVREKTNIFIRQIFLRYLGWGAVIVSVCGPLLAIGLKLRPVF